MKQYFLLFLFLFAGLVSAFTQTISGTYAIKNVQTGLLLRVKDANGKNGTPLVAYSPENWKCMTWNFRHVEGNTYQLQNLFTNKTFEPVSDSEQKQMTLQEQPLEPKKNQQYEFIKEGDYYFIRLKDTGFYITSPGNEVEVNAKILLMRKNNSNMQRWTIYTQNPTM